MKNYASPTQTLTLLLVLVLALIGSIYPILTLLQEREQSQQILKETIRTIQQKLPNPTSSD